MPLSLVECVPNFSEGRRPEVVRAIEDSIRAVPGVLVLDRHSDADHNRSVITFAAPPEGALEAAFRAIARAAELIDMEQQRGEHPRLGSTDVVPFVPLQGASMDECVDLARRLGERVGRELQIPVYLYEAAAARSDRVNLEDIRRGEYEGLKASLGVDPARAPDFGPARLGRAGATVIGARRPLIAYNIYLDTSDVGIAKDIARAIRASSGGFPAVKALGLLVDGRAQVSMNLTDHERTSLPTVFDAVAERAASRGVGVHHSELVGLIPQVALLEAARSHLRLEPYSPDQVLEVRLFRAMAAVAEDQSSFLDRLAAATPTPGGGSAAAQAAAMAAALVGMVARLTLGKKKYADVEGKMEALAAKADAARAELEAAVREDSEAFEGVLRAARLPKATPDQAAARARAVEAATVEAGRVPLRVGRLSADVLEWAAEAAAHGNVNAMSDAASAAALARAALTAAAWNVRVNSKGLGDRSVAEEWSTELRAFEARAAQAEASVRASMGERAGLGQERSAP